MSINSNSLQYQGNIVRAGDFRGGMTIVTLEEHAGVQIVIIDVISSNVIILIEIFITGSVK